MRSTSGVRSSILAALCTIGLTPAASFPLRPLRLFRVPGLAQAHKQCDTPAAARRSPPSRLAMNPVADGDADGRSSFLEWSSSQGVTRGKGVSIESSARNIGGGWGVRVHRSGGGGARVMSVPRELVLSSRDAESLLGDGAVKKSVDILKADGLDSYSSEFFLVVRLLLEEANGESSNWYPWIESLPRTFNMGIYMDDLERSYLPQLAAKLLDLQERQLASFRRAVAFLRETHDGLNSLFATENSDDIVKWAFSIVFSRSWRSPSDADDARIVPIADMFNHADNANILVQEPSGSGGDTEIVLKEDVDRDSELCLSYGPGHDPSRFLIIFGFMDEHVMEVFSGVAFTNPTQELIDLGCSDRAKMVYRTDGAIANAVWDSVLYATLAARPEEQQALYDAHVIGNPEAKTAVHQKYRLEVAAALRDHAEQVLAEQYQEPRESELVNIDPTEHPRLSLILSHNRLMRRTFVKVRDRLDAIIRAEATKRRDAQQDYTGS